MDLRFDGILRKSSSTLDPVESVVDTARECLLGNGLPPLLVIVHLDGRGTARCSGGLLFGGGRASGLARHLILRRGNWAIPETSVDGGGPPIGAQVSSDVVAIPIDVGLGLALAYHITGAFGWGDDVIWVYPLIEQLEEDLLSSSEGCLKGARQSFRADAVELALDPIRVIGWFFPVGMKNILGPIRIIEDVFWGGGDPLGGGSVGKTG